MNVYVFMHYSEPQTTTVFSNLRFKYALYSSVVLIVQQKYRLKINRNVNLTSKENKITI